MATINYNGMELEEFKELKVFDSPFEMCVWNDNDGLPTVRFVCAVIPYRHVGQVITTNGAYEHCALLPDPPKPRRATNRELSRWLAQGNGECLGSQDDADTAWNYPLHHEDARPLYLEIPQDEYDRINSRIAELEEERRWRKFPEEKPELGDIVFVKLSERVKGHYFPMDVVRWDSTYELGEIEVSHWKPLPSAPKEEK